MSESSIQTHIPLWISKIRAMEEFALSEKRLRQLRKEKRITFRLEGNRYVYQTRSLVNYCRGNTTIAEIPEPQNEDERLMLLTKEVLQKEKEKEIREKEELKSLKGGDNV